MNDPILKDVKESFKGVIDAFNRSFTNEERKDSSSEFSRIIQSYNELLNHHELSCTAANEVALSIESGNCNLEQFSASEHFKDKLNSLQETHQLSDHCEDLKKLLNNSVEDCDIEVTGSNVQSVHLDPFSQMPIKQPAKSVKCNHMFDYKTIMRMFNHLKGEKQTLKCPHIGCMAVLTKEDIEKI